MGQIRGTVNRGPSFAFICHWQGMSKTKKRIRHLLLIAATGAGFVALAVAQRPFERGGPPGGGPDAPDLELVKDFDSDEDGRLNDEEREKARASLKKNSSQRGPRRGPPGGGRGGNRPVGKRGPRVKPADVENYPDAELYNPQILRTLFLEFPQQDWEQELADFKPTDVEVPATLRVDGTAYPDVGVSFRGASSFFMIPEGSKRSLNISMDYGDKKQRLYGYKTLNLLNCNGDPSMMSSLLYSNIACERIAAPKVNFVNVVINGRSWGVYSNVQQFNKDFVQENFDTKQGARWKVSGSPRGDAGLRYLGEDMKPYQERFEIKSKDKEESWKELINLCRVLNQTPVEELESALDPILDIEGTLWFLAVDVALINSDGYWTRASDYSIYQSEAGKFHILPHDMNEAFQEMHGGGHGGRSGPGGPRGERRGSRPGEFGGPPLGGPQGGFQGRRPDRERRPRDQGGQRGSQPNRGPRDRNAGGGYELDPLVGIQEERFPLRSKLLAVPKFRELYLQNLRDIATDLIAWQHLGPQVESARDLIRASVKSDTRKLTSYTDFLNATDTKSTQRGSLREFAKQRSNYLLNHPAIKELTR